MTFLFVASQLWRDSCRLRPRRPRRPPSHHALPAAVSLALYFTQKKTFSTVSPDQSPFSYRGLAPQKFTPMFFLGGYALNSSGGLGGLNGSIICACRVIAIRSADDRGVSYAI